MIVNKLKENDQGYPDILRNIPDPPFNIYYAGLAPADWINRPKVTVVGSRKFTPYGKFVTEKLVGELARAGVVIISGLAYGIDVIAHQAALEVGGTTVAVLPAGLHNIYPRGNLNIAYEIAKTGSLISEYPPNSGIAFKSNFIARNRIVSGLADAILIPEANLKSGSLHTTRFALEQGKTVLAVPGNITSPASEGSNNLIKAGAIPVTKVEDIFYALNISPKQLRYQKTFKGTELESTIYSFIKDGVSDQQELVEVARVDPPTLSSTLTMLELAGYIRPAGAGNWVAD